ncbi:hypothetical protein [Arthrobacter sp. ATA002]|uniref:hypothetical protein n=1 Tax=Arthrobacter sp. ATA002 TaxID=2991715 RepID=UPI002E380CE1|nr:hypothetical protein [Arthrobacter sp. ATA002]
MPSETPDSPAAPPWKSEEELGEHLFDVVRLARAGGMDAEAALRAAVARFTRGS